MDIFKECKDILIEYEEIMFAYIFGSYAKNSLKSTSDIDIAIYLEGNLSPNEYLDLKMNLTEATKREVDLVILNNATPLLKFEIYKNHLLLFTRDFSTESNYKIKVLFEYNDMKRYLDLSYNKTIERLKKEVESYGQHRCN